VDKIRYAAGERLPHDVTLLDVCEVHPRFHATRSATSKLYRYRIHNASRKPVAGMTQRYVLHYWRPMDVLRMQDGARHFVGEHDFASMASTGTKPRETTVRRVIRCDVERRGDEVWVSIEGTGFLYNQVRNMVGTLIEVGRGRWEPDYIPEILAARDRRHGGPCIPPTGLCLMWVRYPVEMLAVGCQLSAVCQSEEAEPDPPLADS
jgi:tRNA pseudouridine38-40 synthase